jgi:hypothetical protein
MSADYSARRVRGNPMEMPRFEVSLRCKECGHEYVRVMRARNEVELGKKSNPPCPRCKKQRPVTPPVDWTDARPPAINGAPSVRAIDTTAEIVMQDHGLTDLQDRARPGEIQTPKLAPHLQAQVDNFFAGGIKAPSRRPIKIGGLTPDSPAFRKAVLGGAFASGGAAEAGEAIAQQHRRRSLPNVTIINEQKN